MAEASNANQRRRRVTGYEPAQGDLVWEALLRADAVSSAIAYGFASAPDTQD